MQMRQRKFNRLYYREEKNRLTAEMEKHTGKDFVCYGRKMDICSVGD